MASRFYNVTNAEEFGELKEELENLNKQTSTSKRILTCILSKNSETCEH